MIDASAFGQKLLFYLSLDMKVVTHFILR